MGAEISAGQVNLLKHFTIFMKIFFDHFFLGNKTPSFTSNDMGPYVYCSAENGKLFLRVLKDFRPVIPKETIILYYTYVMNIPGTQMTLIFLLDGEYSLDLW